MGFRRRPGLPHSQKEIRRLLVLLLLLFPTSLCGVLTFGAAPAADRRPTTDRPTDRPPPRSELLLAPPLSFFYTHTRHTHVDSLTHTRQTHTRSLTVPFAHGARAGASLDTHTVDAHTFAHGARARLTLDTHSALQALDGARARFGAPPPLMLPGAALGQGQHFRLWTVPERVSGPPPLDAARRPSLTVPEREPH